jgi:ribosome-associated protein
VTQHLSNESDLLSLVRCAAAAADDKKAIEPLIIDVGEVFAISDYFVIASGTSTRQVHAIVGGIEEDVKRIGGLSPVRIEGIDEHEWVLMDYGPFVVHVFKQEQRDFYQLERLWGDRPRVAWEPNLRPEAELV